MAIIGALPVTLTNGTIADATQVMQDFSFIVTQVNSKAAELTSTPQLNLANIFTQPQTVGAATSRVQAPRVSQVQDGVLNFMTGVAGTNIITGVVAINPGAYTLGAMYWFIPFGTNTGTVTLNINGIGAQAVTLAGQPLVGLEVRLGRAVKVIWNGTSFDIIAGAYGGGPPVGSIIDYAGAITPASALLPFGQSLLRAGIYADLFVAIGVTFGAVDGTHFTLPDVRGRTCVGKDDMGGSAASRITAPIAGFDGTVVGTLGAGGDQQLHAHSHTNVVTDTHTHSLTGPVSFESWGTGPGTGQWTNTVGASTGGTNAGVISVAIANAGAGATQNVQPSIVMNKAMFF